MQDTNITYKILLTIFCGSSQTWYYNLEFRFILNFKDLYAKLKTHFNINIPTIKSSTKLFTITQQEDEVTIIYLKRFKKKMLKLQGLLKFMVIKALIKYIYIYIYIYIYRVQDLAIWREQSALPKKCS